MCRLKFKEDNMYLDINAKKYKTDDISKATIFLSREYAQKYVTKLRLNINLFDFINYDMYKGDNDE